MSRPLFRVLLFITLALGLTLQVVVPALAETVIYPGTSLQNDAWIPNTLGPSGLSAGKSNSVSGNSITLDSGTVGFVIGGYNSNDSDSVTGNDIIVNGGTVSNTGAAIIGGGSSIGDVDGNTVVIHDGTIKGSIRGGDGRTAKNNTVTINNGIMESYVSGGYGGSNDAISTIASGNSVFINGGTIEGAVTGGQIVSFSGTATSTGNAVTIRGGTVNEITWGGVASTTTGSAVASGNIVTIDNGTINGGSIGAVGGGFATSATVGMGNTPTVTASNNIVIINGGTINGHVYGGLASTEGLATATGNSVKISGNPTFGGATVIHGGSASGTGDAFTGNTLNLHSAVNVAGLRNFQYLNFYLPTTLASGSAMLTVSGTADLTDGAGRAATVNVGIAGKRSPLRVGDHVVLIDAGTLVGTPENTTANGQGMQGVTLNYEFDIIKEDNQLLATTTKTGVNPQTKALSEGFLAGLALVNQGGNLVAEQGMVQAVNAADGSGFGAFGAFAGGWSRYNTGSHIDMSSVSLMTGLSWGRDFTPGRLTLGAFFEYGNGSYDTYNSFSAYDSVKGKGDVYHLGGGILGRMDFSNTGPGCLYTEGSFRAGKVHNAYDNSDLRDALGRKANYDASSAYYGAHMGTGYIWNIFDRASLDTYGKYFWTRLEGDSVTLSTDDPVRFKDADSHRLRFGSRFAYTINEYVSPYAGAAYEYEFDGKARATSNGYSIDAPDLKGSTGIGELGLTLKPSATLPLSFDLGVQGYVGVREGVTGSFQAKWEF